MEGFEKSYQQANCYQWKGFESVAYNANLYQWKRFESVADNHNLEVRLRAFRDVVHVAFIDHFQVARLEGSCQVLSNLSAYGAWKNAIERSPRRNANGKRIRVFTKLEKLQWKEAKWEMQTGRGSEC